MTEFKFDPEAVRVVPVVSGYVKQMWPHVADTVHDVVSRDSTMWDAETVHKRLLSEDMQLWLAVCNGAIAIVVVTEIFETSSGKTCGLPIVGGTHMDVCIETVLDVIEGWARDMGCTRLEGVGRKGWVRVLAPFGWREKSVIIEKALT